jgi:cytochrome c oxidase subunit 4
MKRDTAHSEIHITPLKTYLSVGAALLILTAITVTVAQIDLGGWNAIVAVAIASIKAVLVAFIFMHLLYDKKIFLVIFSVSIVFLTIFIALTMFDIISRGDIDPINDQPISAKAAMYDNLKPDSTSHHNEASESGEENQAH